MQKRCSCRFGTVLTFAALLLGGSDRQDGGNGVVWEVLRTQPAWERRRRLISVCGTERSFRTLPRFRCMSSISALCIPVADIFVSFVLCARDVQARHDPKANMTWTWRYCTNRPLLGPDISPLVPPALRHGVGSAMYPVKHSFVRSCEAPAGSSILVMCFRDSHHRP